MVGDWIWNYVAPEQGLASWRDGNWTEIEKRTEWRTLRLGATNLNDEVSGVVTKKGDDQPTPRTGKSELTEP